MNYTDPNMVVSPKSAVKNVRVLEDVGEGGYSVARLQYDGNDVLACRWNGKKGEIYGHPNSRGIPTWFILPSVVKNDVLKGVLSRAKSNPKLSSEIESIRGECDHLMNNPNHTAISIVALSKDITLNEANLIAELISNDSDFVSKKVFVFDTDGDGYRNINPISKLNGALHITLYRQAQ